MYPFSFENALFLCEYVFRPQVSDENGHRKRSSEWNFLNTPFSFHHVDDENGNFLKTMTYQYWIQPIHSKEHGGIWWFYVYALHKA